MKLRGGIKKWVLGLNAIVVLGKNSKFIWPLISLTDRVEEVIPELESVSENTIMITPPYFNAVRNEEGRLILGIKK